MGLTKPGQGARAVLEGWTAKDGRLPVNRSGGLKAKGHPIGATGVSMHVLSAMQLTGQAGDMQLPKADRAGVFNMKWRRCRELRLDPRAAPLTPVQAHQCASSTGRSAPSNMRWVTPPNIASRSRLRL